MIRTQVLLTPELYEAAKAAAKNNNISFSAAVRKSLHNDLIKNKKSSREILLAMAAEAGTSETAPTDLSSNDDYLYKMP